MKSRTSVGRSVYILGLVLAQMLFMLPTSSHAISQECRNKWGGAWFIPSAIITSSLVCSNVNGAKRGDQCVGDLNNCSIPKSGQPGGCGCCPGTYTIDTLKMLGHDTHVETHMCY